MTEQQNEGRATLLEVARLAGVSIASVSRVLNNVPPLSEELRSKVEGAILALGYKTKRSSASHQPMVVALIGDAHNTYFSEILSGIQDQASRQGVLVNVVVNGTEPDFGARFCRWLSRSQAIGLIVCSSNGIPEDELVRIRDLGKIPIASINRLFNTSGIPSVRIDYERAMESLARYLIKFRHRRIAFLSGSEGSFSAKSKQKGVEATLEKLGFPLNPELLVERSSTVEGGFQAMNLLLDLPPERRPTAVIASNDLIALGAMHAIRRRGLSIPGDMSVTAFDDIAMAAHANPPLTSIAPPKFEMGARAMQFIFALGEAEPIRREEYLMMESPLIVRESSGPCPEMNVNLQKI